MGKKSSFKKIISGNKPVLIDFYADWCGPCKSMNPIIKSIAKEFSESVKVVKINIDKNQQLSHQLGIRSIPSFVLYKDGKKVWSKIGMVSKTELKKIILSKVK